MLDKHNVFLYTNYIGPLMEYFAKQTFDIPMPHREIYTTSVIIYALKL